MFVTGLALTGVSLLERAVAYALGAVHTVFPPMLSRPTPCRDWDLRVLLWHLNESVAALHEGVRAGRIAMTAAAAVAVDAAATDPVRTFREEARRLLGAWPGATALIAIGDCPLTMDLVACAGAVEIAVHGWDVSQATGQRRPIPPALAVDLLPICPLVAGDAIREPFFAPRVPVSPSAGPSERLIAYLGRGL
jgi:uncharacterized protein (TIGR03086 family)